MKRKPMIDKNGEVRELTKADMRRFRPAREVVPNIVKAYEAGTLRPRGRPVGRKKAVISLSIDKEIVDSLRASGAGWQTRVNDLLKAAVGINAP